MRFDAMVGSSLAPCLRLKKPVTIRLDEDVIEYSRALSEKEEIPYQTLMNPFLRFCKDEKLQFETNWKKAIG